MFGVECAGQIYESAVVDSVMRPSDLGGPCHMVQPERFMWHEALFAESGHSLQCEGTDEVVYSIPTHPPLLIARFDVLSS
jgi:hypothetical protein